MDRAVKVYVTDELEDRVVFKLTTRASFGRVTPEGRLFAVELAL